MAAEHHRRRRNSAAAAAAADDDAVRTSELAAGPLQADRGTVSGWLPAEELDSDRVTAVDVVEETEATDVVDLQDLVKDGIGNLIEATGVVGLGVRVKDADAVVRIEASDVDGLVVSLEILVNADAVGRTEATHAARLEIPEKSGVVDWIEVTLGLEILVNADVVGRTEATDVEGLEVPVKAGVVG